MRAPLISLGGVCVCVHQMLTLCFMHPLMRIKGNPVARYDDYLIPILQRRELGSAPDSGACSHTQV